MVQPRRYEMTRERFDELNEELRRLEEEERPALAARLKEAIAQGDLKENANYISAKEDQGFLEGRINELKEQINGAVIVEGWKKVTVVEKGTDFEETYEIVGKTDADPRNMKVSSDSPIGKALVNAKPGDEVTVKAPAGDIVFIVKGIS